MSVLLRVLSAARQPDAIVAFDLDSTLLDNRPRSARILREFGAAMGVHALLGAAPEHLQGWSLLRAMVRAGVAHDQAQSLMGALKEFWFQRFFANDYCLEDRCIAGAPEYVSAVATAGAKIAYVTGRHEGMRPGTLASMAREGFPMTSGRVAFLLKPTFETHDDAWKIEAQQHLRAMGYVVAAFDNEPTHINSYGEAFPNAILVHLATDHSGRDVPLRADVTQVASFVLAPA